MIIKKTNVLNSHPVFFDLVFEDLIRKDSTHLRMYAENKEFDVRTQIFEDKNFFKIELLVPSFSKDEIFISEQNSVLKVKSDTKKNKSLKDDIFSNYSFEKSFKIPVSCNQLKISAKLENGILSITIPKKRLQKPKRIKIS
mgnify:CR=1 FL=1